MGNEMNYELKLKEIDKMYKEQTGRNFTDLDLDDENSYKNNFWIFFDVDSNGTGHWSINKNEVLEILKEGFYDGLGERNEDYLITDKELNMIYDNGGNSPYIRRTVNKNVFMVGDRIVDLETKQGFDYWDTFELYKVAKEDEEVECDRQILDSRNTYHDDKVRVLYAIIDSNPNDMILEYVSDRLKNDKEVVLRAVEKNSLQFAFASEEMQKDKEITNLVNDTALRYAKEVQEQKERYAEYIKSLSEVKEVILDRTVEDINTTKDEFAQAMDERENDEQTIGK